MTVRILEDALVNQIAAGEVVERPASVVKELVENALDAGARRVGVTLKAGGRSLVRVTDDGSGMDRHDAMTCLERHATSKILTQADLVKVRSLGFRGEAIPSIASVSRFSLLTRRADDEVGTRVVVEGGTLRDVAEAGCAAGTEVDVRSLFYNVPVRRKFLRTTPTELGHCVEAVTREALAHPDVDFEVTHDGRSVLRAPAVADRARRAADLLGEHGARLVPVGFSELGFEVTGLVSPVGVHRSSAAASSYLYVNGRYVRDPVLRRGLAEAYRGIVPKGRYPVVVLDVRLDPERVDVNVHPAKTEVRFRDPRDLTRILATGVRAALERHGLRAPVDRAGPAPSASPPVQAPELPLPAPAAPPPAAWPPAPRPAGDVRSMQTSRPVDPRAVYVAPPRPAHRAPPPAPRPPAPLLVAEGEPGPPRDALLPVPRYRDLRVIGQLARTYVLCEGRGELVAIDQHAAHERIVLHRLMRDRDARVGGGQTLLTPILVELPAGKLELLCDHLDALSSVHLEASKLSPTSLAVTSVPPLLSDVDIPSLVRDLADEVASSGHARAGEDLVERMLSTMACHSSVRANQALSEFEMRALLAALDEVDFGVCAHGRPVAIRVSLKELEHRFHRS